MQSEIKFLLELVLNHKIPPEARKLCLERIGEVESNLIARIHPQPNIITPVAMQKSQAQLKYELEQATGAPVTETPTIVAPAVAPKLVPAASRIIGGEVKTGNGTRGPRKF